ncbi:receptor-like protein kinase FERONIA [Beta vulgaris subsp. vulgaris]|uniref:receptor-like protein kinase FERONIA n=1 Tax=Beta vulgaris subsp. vulgaris TaxID=3555 RepID=UPI0020370ACA|nr:receptor-like protein kinase FERONIA [Beta vulgaris subsp. vulgaris]
MSNDDSASNDDPPDPWQSDERFLVTPLPSAANSIALAKAEVSPPFDRARVFRAPTTYSIPVSSPGPKFIRLYLFPPSLTSYDIIDATQSYLSLTINGREILGNFSGYIVTANANAKTNTIAPASGGLVREIYMTVNKTVNLTFSPSNSNGFGFISGVHVISMPDGLYINTSSLNQVPYLTSQFSDHAYNNYFSFPTSLAMENVVRLNVGGITVGPEDDTGIRRTWYADDNFATSFIDSPSTPPVTLNNIRVNIIEYTVSAPRLVYSTARTLGPFDTPAKNMTLGFEVDNGFNYLVRLHFCEIDQNINKTGQRAFYIYVNNQKAALLDVFQNAGGLNIPIHSDFVTLVDAHDGADVTTNASSGSRVVLWVALLPYPNSEYADVILNGLEIFKLSPSNGSLVAPNPALPDSMIPAVPTNYTPTQAKSHHFFAIIGGIFGFLIIVSLLTYICFMIIYRRNKMAKQKFLNKTSTKDSSNLKWVSPFGNSGSASTTTSAASSLPYALCRRFSLAQIRVATCDFDKKLIVGRGGFGTVYMGSIEGETTTVAIKRLNTTSKQGTHEFQTEIEMLSRLRHVNLVSLIGYCEDQGEMILVYEYMSRGTLRDHLLYKNTNKKDQSDNISLSWKERLKICIGSARGLHYLHAGTKQVIIHRDVKSTNILLDDKWTAKVSDFGLSKVGPDLDGAGITHISTVVKGSVGYLDPEYYQRRQLTEKSDVYSFGVVLFEVLCARAVVKPNLPREQANLARWATTRYKSGILNTIVDPNLTGQISPECLRKFGEIASMCVRDRGSERPPMGDIVWGLEFALQLQEAAEKNNTNGADFEDFSISTNIDLNERILIYDSYASGDDLSRSSNLVFGEGRILDSKSSASNSSNYPIDKSASVFSEIMDPKAR